MAPARRFALAGNTALAVLALGAMITMHVVAYAWAPAGHLERMAAASMRVAGAEVLAVAAGSADHGTHVPANSHHEDASPEAGIVGAVCAAALLAAVATLNRPRRRTGSLRPDRVGTPRTRLFGPEPPVPRRSIAF